MEIGRNSPCVCGSGKKYKNCCLGKEEMSPPNALSPAREELSYLDSLLQAGNHTELERAARSLLKLHKNSGIVWKLLGLSLQMQGKESLPELKKAVDFLPEDAEAHANLAGALRSIGKLNEAVASGRRAVQIKPDFAEAHNNLGVALKGLGKFDEAVSSFRHAVQIKPDFAQAHFNLANTLNDIGQFAAAEASYRQALELKPDFMDARSNLLFSLNFVGHHPPSYCLEEARQYGKMAASKVTSRFVTWQCETSPSRLRVGMVSGDMHNHPVGYFLESLLAQIDSSRVELVAYPTSRKSDQVTARIKPYFSAWRPLTGLNDHMAAQKIHADGVHVLLDLSGHTGRNRLPVFAWKPAPVQASWLGYFATTGLAEMDYLLADHKGVPEACRECFSEEVWYLPDTRLCFTPPRTDLPVATLPALKNGYITFGCFQRLSKVGDEVMAAWGRIFAALPDARLRWQCSQMKDESVKRQLIRRLGQHGISSERIMLYSEVSREEYLAAHAEVDFLLDTFPYPGGTTTCEALWMGVPTLTLTGETLLARQGVSLLAAAGLENWIADNVNDYVDKAISLSRDLPERSVLRAGLREQVRESALFDAPHFARGLEDALWGMWRAKR